MSDSLTTELLHHAAALRALARVLVGEQHADDLVQDTALQALRRPPQHRGALHGWFVAVLRHFASKHHRRERVRRQPLALPPPAELPPDLLAAQRETIQQLTAAVVALPEPYQRAVLLRFFQDLTPTAIAQQTGEPLATVKSRLQRALAMLRQRLDRGDGRSDWRGALTGAFGLERATAAAGGVALGTGVLLMGTGVKFAIGGAAAVVAVAATLFVCMESPVARSATSARSSGLAVAAAGLDAVRSPKKTGAESMRGGSGAAAGSDRAAGEIAEWSTLERRSGSLARLFALVPTGVTESKLLRDTTLNPSDTPVGEVARGALRTVVAQRVAEISDCLGARSLAQHKMLLDLRAAGQLIELNERTVSAEILKKAEQRARINTGALARAAARAGAPLIIQPDQRGALLDALQDMARDIVPGAAAFMRAQDSLFIATCAQLPGLSVHDALRDQLSLQFLEDVLAWSLHLGLMTAKQAEAEVASFATWTESK